MTPRVTVNLGIRYEVISVVKERNGLEGNFDPNSPTGVVQVGYGLTSPYNGDHNNFSPRVGLALDVRGNGKTVIRAGGSLMYEALPIATFSDIANSLGLSLEPTAATRSIVQRLPAVRAARRSCRRAMEPAESPELVVAGTNGLNAGWQAQTAARRFYTGCGPVIPASVIGVSCGTVDSSIITIPVFPGTHRLAISALLTGISAHLTSAPGRSTFSSRLPITFPCRLPMSAPMEPN